MQGVHARRSMLNHTPPRREFREERSLSCINVRATFLLEFSQASHAAKTTLIECVIYFGDLYTSQGFIRRSSQRVKSLYMQNASLEMARRRR